MVRPTRLYLIWWYIPGYPYLNIVHKHMHIPGCTSRYFLNIVHMYIPGCTSRYNINIVHMYTPGCTSRYNLNIVHMYIPGCTSRYNLNIVHMYIPGCTSRYRSNKGPVVGSVPVQVLSAALGLCLL